VKLQSYQYSYSSKQTEIRVCFVVYLIFISNLVQKARRTVDIGETTSNQLVVLLAYSSLSTFRYYWLPYFWRIKYQKFRN